jgi:hypothetical protein
MSEYFAFELLILEQELWHRHATFSPLCKAIGDPILPFKDNIS